MNITCRLLAAGILAALALPGCQTNPITGRSQLALVSESEAIAASGQAYASTLQQARTKGRLDTSPELNQRITAITNRLIPQAQRLRPESRTWKWSVHVIDDKQVNAWCMAGGKMAIFTGLLDQIQPTDAEIAQVMGHEISHALLSHQREKMSQVMATQSVLLIGSLATGYNLTNLGSLAQVAVLLPNSRQAETEADRLGIEIAARAGYDPNAAVTLWKKMASQAGEKPPEFLSTHPSDDSRIASLSALAPRMMPLYEAARNGGN